MIGELSNRGIRLSLDAEKFISENKSQELFEKILALNKPLITKEDIVPFINVVEIRRADSFNPNAKEYSSDIKFDHKLDVTGKSRTKGGVDNFVNFFRNRYERLSKMLRRAGSGDNLDLCDMSRHIDQSGRIIVIITDIRETKKGNLLLEVEDLTGQFKVVVSSEKIKEKAARIIKDDVVAISGKIFEPFLIAEDIEWPDLPVIREKKRSENDLAVAYLSDIHFGSKNFLSRYLEQFSLWLHGKGEARQLAGKVKYLHIAGDVVDGIGVYPNQEKELAVKDIYKQYELFDDFVEDLPDHIEIIVGPGNHDAVRRGEPQPAMGKDLINSDVHKVGNPCSFSVEGIKHLMYHGTSMDSIIASVPNLSYNHPEVVMTEFLKRRHLSPIYGGNLIIPENIDYMVVEEPPDVLHSGHVHKNGYTQYRGTLVINSGTFQDRTEFQIKQGHVPTPALVPILELKYGRLHTLDFKS